MAHVYVRSGASGANNGSTKTDAYTTLGAAFTAKAAGDNFWIASDHAETQASAMTLTSPGTPASPCTAICVNFAGSTPPVSADFRTTATITTTGNSALNIDKSCYYYGITFNCGTGAVAATLTVGQATNSHHLSFKSCKLKKLGTVGGSSMVFTQNNLIVLDDTQLDFGHADDNIWILASRFLWKNTAAPIVSTYPTTLFSANQLAGMGEFHGVDFSNAGFSGKTILGTNAYCVGSWVFKNCKKHASLTLAATPTSLAQGPVVSLNTDSSGTNYNHETIDYCGAQTVETTIVRTGGATDGWVPLAWKIITTANSEWTFPFQTTLPMAIPNDTISSNVTVTVYGVWGGGAVPTNREIWMEISYMGSSGSPIATINTANGAADYLATATNQATDSSTWGGSTTKFKMAVTLSSPQPALRGPIYVTVKAAKASDTFYIDPKPVLS